MACGSVEQISFGSAEAVSDAGSPVVAARPDGSMSGPSSQLNIAADAGPYSYDDAGPCAVVRSKATPVPLDILILLDQSGSMASTSGHGTKWAQVVEAIRRFAADPGSSGIEVALQYFSLPLAGQSIPTDTEHSCNIVDYSHPEVPMGALPGNLGPITTSMAKHQPSGPSPTYEALEGARDYAVPWAEAHPTHRVVLVMATDGGPHLCASTDANTQAAALLAFTGKPSIATYVIGVGPDQDLSAIAAAGGTGKPYLVDVSDLATDQFITAMQQIRAGEGLPCAYRVPVPTNGASIDFGKLNLDYYPGLKFPTSTMAQLFQVTGPSKCPTGQLAWYYDDATSPHSVLLCSDTCSKFKQDIGGQLVIAVGCQTRVIVN
jgi:hypothetical protein